MADRLLVFSNPEVQKLLAENFIPVAADDWYQRRRQDAEGEFFRSVAAQGPRRTPGGTRQGHYVLTSDGKLLGYNNNRGPERRLAMMKEALKKWNKLSIEEQKRAIPVQPKSDPKYNPKMPEGTQIIKVYTRALDKNEGALRAAIADQTTFLTAVDHLWLTLADLKKLQTGNTFPSDLAMRIARYHLRDNTRGEPRAWTASEVKKMSLVLLKDGQVSGEFLIESKDRKLGYQGQITGQLSFHKNQLHNFQLLVTGEHWGEGRFTKGARPGRSQLGQVYQLISGDQPADQIPPQGVKQSGGSYLR